MPGDRKVAVGAVDLDAYPSHMRSTPELPPWQHEGLRSNPDPNSRATRRDLGVGLEALDPVLHPLLDFTGLGVTAVVDVNPDVGIIQRDDEADAVYPTVRIEGFGVLQGTP